MTVHFYTAYDENKTIIGTARTNEKNGEQCITRRTYNRLMKHRKIGGCANIRPIECDVYVIDYNGTLFAWLW